MQTSNKKLVRLKLFFVHANKTTTQVYLPDIRGVILLLFRLTRLKYKKIENHVIEFKNKTCNVCFKTEDDISDSQL